MADTPSNLERKAARLVESHTGLRVVFNDHGVGNGLVDFLILGTHGDRVGVMEVTSSVDKARFSLKSEILKRAPKFKFEVESSESLWSICVTTNTKFKRLAEIIEAVICDLESLRPVHAVVVSDAVWSNGHGLPREINAILDEVGVTRITSHDSSESSTGIVEINLSFAGWIGGWDRLNEIFYENAWKPDNVSKMKPANKLERSILFLWLDRLEFASSGIREEGPTAPELPSHITNVYVATRDFGEIVPRVWHSSGGPWEEVLKIGEVSQSQVESSDSEIR